jgi:predicted enzyme related to lactoylglutathione lyase
MGESDDHGSPHDDGAVPSGTPHISFYCDDIHRTVTELKGRGVEFTEQVADRGYGLVTHFKVPGGFTVQLYQPKYERKAAWKTMNCFDSSSSARCRSSSGRTART